MGITINREQAMLRFGEALHLALTDAVLPTDWLERAKKIGEAKSKTFTPVLGTALLAKATDDAVDALALREDAGHKGYSARSLAKEVLVVGCVRAGIDLRNKGAEPLNNQPFLRAARVTKDLSVKKNAKEEFEYLCETLQIADFLRGRDALEALAAFLRVRIAASARPASVELGPGVLEVGALQVALDRFLEGDPEGGKVGQAVATAMLELVFAKVETKSINDPSNRWPGDVAAFDAEVQILSAEVKQRPFSAEEILLFAQRLRDAGVQRGFVVALRQQNVELDETWLADEARALYGVELSFFTRASALLADVIRYSRTDVRLSLARFPRDVVKRMEELEVSQARVREWAAHFGASGSTPPAATT